LHQDFIKRESGGIVWILGRHSAGLGDPQKAKELIPHLVPEGRPQLKLSSGGGRTLKDAKHAFGLEIKEKSRSCPDN